MEIEILSSEPESSVFSGLFNSDVVVKAKLGEGESGEKLLKPMMVLGDLKIYIESTSAKCPKSFLKNAVNGMAVSGGFEVNIKHPQWTIFEVEYMLEIFNYCDEFPVLNHFQESEEGVIYRDFDDSSTWASFESFMQA